MEVDVKISFISFGSFLGFKISKTVKNTYCTESVEIIVSGVSLTYLINFILSLYSTAFNRNSRMENEIVGMNLFTLFFFIIRFKFKDS